MVLLFDLPGALLDATIATMPPRKKPSPKKPPVRKRRANTLLQGPGKKDSSSGTVKPAVNVPATPVQTTQSDYVLPKYRTFPAVLILADVLPEGHYWPVWRDDRKKS